MGSMDITKHVKTFFSSVLIDNKTYTESNLDDISVNSREDKYWERVKTFSVIKWPTKPLCISPLVCARYGWQNIKYNLLKCVTCKKLLSSNLPDLWEDYYDKALQKLVNMLVTNHDAYCSWQFNPTPDIVSTLPFQSIDDNLTTKYITLTLNYLNQLQVIPKLNLNKCSDFKISEMKLIYGKFYEGIDIKNIHKLRFGQRERNIIIMAMCGWQKKEKYQDIIECKYCQRHVGLWNFDVVKKSQLKSHPIKESLNECKSLIIAKKRTNDELGNYLYASKKSKLSCNGNLSDHINAGDIKQKSGANNSLLDNTDIIDAPLEKNNYIDSEITQIDELNNNQNCIIAMINEVVDNVSSALNAEEHLLHTNQIINPNAIPNVLNEDMSDLCPKFSVNKHENGANNAENIGEINLNDGKNSDMQCDDETPINGYKEDEVLVNGHKDETIVNDHKKDLIKGKIRVGLIKCLANEDGSTINVNKLQEPDTNILISNPNLSKNNEEKNVVDSVVPSIEKLNHEQEEESDETSELVIQSLEPISQHRSWCPWVNDHKYYEFYKRLVFICKNLD